MGELKKILSDLRNIRGFDTNYYVEEKIKRINDFFSSNGLDSAVIGLSGGVDSSLVYSLLEQAKKSSGSPIKRILGLIMPIRSTGTTGQRLAMEKAVNFANSINGEYKVVDLSDVNYSYIESSGFSKSPDPWSVGQLASIVRTPCLYFHAALLQSEGYKSIVVGTTNRDEGSYIGFFGKASDAMVDLQPIGDLHKSEVYLVAKKLGVPDYITEDHPRGDVWDGKIDEEMIGAPYWFLEMYLLLKDHKIPFSPEIGKCLSNSGIIDFSEEIPIYEKYSSAIEDIHRKNAHKYGVGSPAYFIDVYKRKVEGGWQ